MRTRRILWRCVTLTVLLGLLTTGPVDAERAAVRLLNQKPEQQKIWTGVHLGNRGDPNPARYPDWDSTLLNEVTGPPEGSGIWPAAVVVLSNQVYSVTRSGPNCNISGMEVARPNILAYLAQAASHGTQVIIRIYPSPGNYEDYSIGNTHYHRLRTYQFRSNACEPDSWRTPQDVATEIEQIHYLNSIQGYLPEYGFEPANEPNLPQWSGGWQKPDDGPAGWVPDVRDFDAWVEMQYYFGNIYQHVKDYDQTIRVLTPPMGQSFYAEMLNVQGDDCALMTLRDGRYGYYDMLYYLRYQNDGIDWHNYWDVSREAYYQCPFGQHVSYYFGPQLRQWIIDHNTALHITEADLYSPIQQAWGVKIADKDMAGGVPAADSIRDFFQHETESWTIYSPSLGVTSISWLNSDNTFCWVGTDPPCDHDWHAAFAETPGPPYSPRMWYTVWYLGSEGLLK